MVLKVIPYNALHHYIGTSVTLKYDIRSVMLPVSAARSLLYCYPYILNLNRVVTSVNAVAALAIHFLKSILDWLNQIRAHLKLINVHQT